MFLTVVKVSHTGGQTRLCVPKEVAVESGLYDSEYAEIRLAENGVLEVRCYEYRGEGETWLPPGGIKPS